jgi:hypothetical protein
MIHNSLIYADKFGSAPMRAVWSEVPMAQRWLEGLAELGRGYALSLMDIQQQRECDMSRFPPELHAFPNCFRQSIAAVESANTTFLKVVSFPSPNA